MDLLIKTKRDLLRLESELLDIKVELKFARLVRAAVKAGFREEQPRDERGRWTDAGSGSTDFSAQRRRKAVIDYSNALTGISTIDGATKSLSKTLGRTMETMDFIPEWTPQVYGTAVHVAFGTAVRFEGLRGIGFYDVEHSFKDGGDAKNGELGSIRTDVSLRNEIGDVIAIYDVKTGRAGLSPARVREIRRHTGVLSNVPIIEMHILRGASIKSNSLQVLARIWRPEDHQDSEYLAEAG
jgi:hypothetical protein